jgi:uncharacterized membrane-anchored protein YhcB (DUF1043 family)
MSSIFLRGYKMTDLVQGGSPWATTILGDKSHHGCDTAKITEAIGNAALHGINAEHVTQKSVGDAAHHLLNAEQVTQKSIGDASRDILLDNAALKNQLNQDGNFTRSEIKAEGRNLDNKICNVEHHMSDFRQEVAKSFCETNSLIQENKFEFTKQLGDLQYRLSEKSNDIKQEVIKQGNDNRFHLSEVERRSIADELNELRIKTACCNHRP